MRGVFLSLTLSGWAGAAGYGSLIDAVDQAQFRVLVYAPSIYDQELAESLRRARLDPIRKVEVRILSVPFFNFQPKSFMLSLALAGVPVYEAQIPSLDGLVIVDNQGWKGHDLGKSPSSEVSPMTAQDINTSLKWFAGSLKKAKVLTQVEAYERLKKVTP